MLPFVYNTGNTNIGYALFSLPGLPNACQAGGCGSSPFTTREQPINDIQRQLKVYLTKT